MPHKKKCPIVQPLIISWFLTGWSCLRPLTVYLNWKMWPGVPASNSIPELVWGPQLGQHAPVYLWHEEVPRWAGIQKPTWTGRGLQVGRPPPAYLKRKRSLVGRPTPAYLWPEEVSRWAGFQMPTWTGRGLQVGRPPPSPVAGTCSRYDNRCRSRQPLSPSCMGMDIKYAKFRDILADYCLFLETSELFPTSHEKSDFGDKSRNRKRT